MDVIRAASTQTGPKAQGRWPVEIRAAVELAFAVLLLRLPRAVVPRGPAAVVLRSR